MNDSRKEPVLPSIEQVVYLNDLTKPGYGRMQFNLSSAEMCN